MRGTKKNYLIAIFGLVLAGCASPPERQAVAGWADRGIEPRARAEQARSPQRPGRQAQGQPGANTGLIEPLQRHFQSWRGTPYRFGGSSQRGIDCSGFVVVTFRDVFGLQLPRTTDLLSRTGRSIPPDQLSSGDLVFFRTGRAQKHVGIYIGNGKFMHASSSRGVTASSLHSPYWSKAFRQSRRIIADRRVSGIYPGS